MRLILLTLLTMTAFAANSLLTRAAVEPGHITPQGFAILRVAAGALTLGALVALRGGALPLLRLARLPGAVSLALYMTGFSLAYITLDAGLGALILFGVTQIVMFLHGAVTGAPPTRRQIAGATLAFAGLALVLWPTRGAVSDPVGAALMVAAGIGWGIYTIVGRGAGDPLAATAANFILCLPLVVLALAAYGFEANAYGVSLSLFSGAATSGLGYALWYTILPRMKGATAAVVQLSVPIIAILGGAVLLGEAVSATVLIATVLVLGGIGWAVTAPRPKAARADRR
ncbi:DMT family transporter [Sulfitobacter sp. HNIBRBA3233]|uniref:DMT family transporter n=1 Tax=Sulfitobacter marinivivus TaxID=3158558 RepID=UPI0032DF642D